MGYCAGRLPRCVRYAMSTAIDVLQASNVDDGAFVLICVSVLSGSCRSSGARLSLDIPSSWAKRFEDGRYVLWCWKIVTTGVAGAVYPRWPGFRKVVRTVPELLSEILYYYDRSLFRKHTTPACAWYRINSGFVFATGSMRERPQQK
jgi:hypothetical protein